MRIGLDIGGSKIAGALFSDEGSKVAYKIVPLPKGYADLLAICRGMVEAFDAEGGQGASIGAGIPGIVDSAQGTVASANIPYMKGHAFRGDLEKALGRPVCLANDAVCAALAEAKEGAGKGRRSVFLLILGTGVGGAQVIDGKVIENTAGQAGEIGHRPLPFREPQDGPAVACACGLEGCIDKSASGPALARLYESMTGKKTNGAPITEILEQDTANAPRVLDRYYTIVAKAMATVLDDFMPDIVVVSGGLFGLPGLYEEVPKRWKRYIENGNPKTLFVPARLGAMSGVRGAAMIGSLSPER